MRPSSFQRLAVLTTLLTYLLIAVGGLVRASGAGLGCPDWPRCFGSWIPPASAAELPPQFDASQFNPTLMWTEYLNRLFGVTTGFAILATTIAAWRAHRRDPRIVAGATATLLLTGFQGWLGGRVVANELAPWIVTAHMLVALVMVLMLQWTIVESMAAGATAPVNATRRTLVWWGTAATTLLLVQVALGTLVRGQVDVALDTAVPRADVVGGLGALQAWHRAMALVVAVAVAALWARTWTSHREDRRLVAAASVALACTAIQFAAGLSLAALGLPPAAQVTHLTVASLLFGALTTLVLLARRSHAPLR